MGLKTTVVPPDVLRAFTSGLGNYVDPSRPLWSVMQKEYVAHEWYSLVLSGIDKLKGSKIFPEAHLLSTGWRFMATDGDVYGGCHVGSPRTNARPMLTGFSWDSQVLTFMESLEELKTLPEVGGPVQFELRGLNVRWLHFEAFWLHTDTGVGDLVVPYTGFVEGSPNYLELMRPYSVENFLIAIGPCAERALARDQPPNKKTTLISLAEAEKTARDQEASARKVEEAWNAEAQTPAAEPPKKQRRAPRKKRPAPRKRV
jgi:hypothetical protein